MEILQKGLTVRVLQVHSRSLELTRVDRPHVTSVSVLWYGPVSYRFRVKG